MGEDNFTRALFPDNVQHVGNDTTHNAHSSANETIQPECRPTIAITPPAESPSAHLAPNPSYAYENDYRQTKLSAIPQKSTFHTQVAWRHCDGAEANRCRSRSRSGGNEDGHRSIDPSPSRRRLGIVSLVDTGNTHGDGRAFLDRVNAEAQHDIMKTNPIYADVTASQAESIAEATEDTVRECSVYRFEEALLLLQDKQDKRSSVPTRTRETPGRGDKKNQRVAEKIPAPSTGKWRCCECQRGHDIYRLDEGEHVLSILSCLCKHRSCRSCTFSGNVRRFAPIDDIAGVAFVPVNSDRGENNCFGVVCRTCGLSWRAKSTQKPKAQASLCRKLSVLPKKVNPLQKLRHTRSMIHLGLTRDHHPNGGRPSTTLLTSQSALNLRAASDPQDKSERLGEQAPGAEVRFFGIECTCGRITDSKSLCFQLVDIAEVDNGLMERKWEIDAGRAARPYVTPDLRSKGYGTPLLHLKGGTHPNPLLSHSAEVSRACE